MGLSITGLTVRHGPATILRGLDLHVPPGELFVLLGASGSGKTTLLRAIAGFVQPDAGRIVLNGADLTGLPPHRRPVNTMFQSYALFPHMTVAGNIGFGLRRKGASAAETSRVVGQMLALVRLEGFGDRRISQLSGGQQQRVALARGLAAKPDLLLLDEPLSALDYGLRRQTRLELAAVQRQTGASFIVVTHDQEEALSLGHRIGVMRDGVLAQVGTPEDVYERPNSRFVAAFLGLANILPAIVRADGRTIDLASGTIHTGEYAPPGPALLALRPERLRLNDLAAANQLRGVVTEQSYQGEALSLTVRLPCGTDLRVRTALGDGRVAMPVTIGAVVAVTWHPDACIVLPP